MPFETLLLEKKDGIGLLTMNRPDRMNAFNQQMEAEFVQALQEADQDDEIRVLVVTGAGKSFCAGADVGRMSAEERERKPKGAEEFRRGFRNIQGIILGLYRCRNKEEGLLAWASDFLEESACDAVAMLLERSKGKRKRPVTIPENFFEVAPEWEEMLKRIVQRYSTRRKDRK